MSKKEPQTFDQAWFEFSTEISESLLEHCGSTRSEKNAFSCRPVA